MKIRRRENRLQWTVSVAETFLLYGEKGDGDNLRGVRMGVLANRVSRRYRLPDDEAILLAKRALDQLVVQGLAVFHDGVFHPTLKLTQREPHEGLVPAVVLRAGQWRTLGYKIPSDILDETNVMNVREDDDGKVSFEVLRD